MNRLVSWCDNNNLQLNASKTREMIVDFRKRKTPPAPIIINSDSIEISFKFLCTIISSDLGRENTTDTVVKKAQQRLFFLRQLKKSELRSEILVQFYRSAIESILTFSISVWFGGISQCQRSTLDRVVKTDSKIVDIELNSLTVIIQRQIQKKSWQYYLRPNSPRPSSFRIITVRQTF